MAISRETLSEIRYDFNTGPDNQTLEIPGDENFWNWFRENASEYPINTEFESSIPCDSITPGNCMGNSQVIALQDNKNYIEGFVKTNNRYILHGYNACDGIVEDSTVKCNIEEFTDEQDNHPNDYVGIMIPIDYLVRNTPDDITDNFVNLPSLIYEYFRSINE